MNEQSDSPWRVLWTGLGILACFALATSLRLLAGASALALPLLVAATLALTALCMWRSRGRSIGWPSRLCAITIALVFVPLLYGSLASGDRSWDGLTAFTLRARVLHAGGLEHPFFADEAACNYTRHYPLLLPLLLSSFADFSERAGRIVLPALWLLWLASISLGLSRVARGRRELCLCAAALTPIFVGPGHGAVDSGFAEVLHAALLTSAAVALLEGRASRVQALVALPAFLLPLSKVEGVGHCLLLVAVAALFCARRAFLSAAFGATLGLAIQALVLVRSSGGSIQVSPGTAALVAALAPWVVLGLAASVRAALRSTGYWLLVFVLAGALVFAASGFDAYPWFREVAGGAFDAASLGQILARFAFQIVNVKKFGLAWLVLLALCVICRSRWSGARAASGSSGDASSAALGSPPRASSQFAPSPLACELASPRFAALWALIAGHVLLVAAFLATRPEGTLKLFVKEGLPRYTAQIVGLAWIAIGLLMERASIGPELLPWDRDAPVRAEDRGVSA